MQVRIPLLSLTFILLLSLPPTHSTPSSSSPPTQIVITLNTYLTPTSLTTLATLLTSPYSTPFLCGTTPLTYVPPPSSPPTSRPFYSDVLSFSAPPSCTTSLLANPTSSLAILSSLLSSSPASPTRLFPDAPFVPRKLSSLSPRRSLASVDTVSMLGGNSLWAYGASGKGVRVAIFDTGMRENHPAFANVEEITNWTDDETSEDTIGHGSFVAGLVGSRLASCSGFAQDATLLVFRVFTSGQMSYTAWFLDAFNYALQSDVHVLNLSIGGPDFSDEPFMAKINELSANNVIVVSAIGNDGPLYGTLNNPGDQPDVIGVGGIDKHEQMASFSSRGMTTWEIPSGYGRIKPDIVTHSMGVRGVAIDGGCRTLSGTSVASPVVAGAITLLISTIPEHTRTSNPTLINPASMKQALLESARRVADANVFEQGAGMLNLQGAAGILASYTPRASAFPAVVDLTDCPYMWPYCSMPLYYSAMPTIVNITLLNGMGVHGELLGEPHYDSDCPGILELSFSHSAVLWPWTGYLALSFAVTVDGRELSRTCSGTVQVTIISLSSGSLLSTELDIPFTVPIIPTPPRENRLLWDQFHNLRYPPGYFPRDAMGLGADVLDWNGDHPHTNFRSLFNTLIDAGYYVEILGVPYTCFIPEYYGALLLVDPEEEYYAAEVTALRDAVEESDLSILVVAEWFNPDMDKELTFFDEATKQNWNPLTGGANIPALNELLYPLGIAFSDAVVSGTLSLPGGDVVLDAASGIGTFPQAARVAGGKFRSSLASAKAMYVDILGIVPRTPEYPSRGAIGVMTDSSCLDDSVQTRDCSWVLLRMLDHISRKLPLADADLGLGPPLPEPYLAGSASLPTRISGALSFYSHVIRDKVHASKCAASARGSHHTHVHRLTDKITANTFYHNAVLKTQFKGRPNVRLGPRPIVEPGEGPSSSGPWSFQDFLLSLPSILASAFFSRLKTAVSHAGLWSLVFLSLALYLIRLIWHRVSRSSTYSLSPKDIV